MDKTKAILAGSLLVLAGAVGAPLILGDADAAEIVDAEDIAILDVVVDEFGGTRAGHVKPIIAELGRKADARFQARALSALLYMRANPDEPFGPQGAKWAQVKAALLAAEVAAKAEDPE